MLARREDIAEELKAIRSPERGVLSEQYAARPGAQRVTMPFTYYGVSLHWGEEVFRV